MLINFCFLRKSRVKRTIRVPAISSKIADIPPDEYSWRKYGQKPIKGSPYPRYYSIPSSIFMLNRSKSNADLKVLSFFRKKKKLWLRSMIKDRTLFGFPNKFICCFECSIYWKFIFGFSSLNQRKKLLRLRVFDYFSQTLNIFKSLINVLKLHFTSIVYMPNVKLNWNLSLIIPILFNEQYYKKEHIRNWI